MLEAQDEPIEEISLLDLCNANPHLCGFKGSEHRRRLQKFFTRIKARIKRDGHTAYLNTLNLYGVNQSKQETNTTADMIDEKLPDFNKLALDGEDTEGEEEEESISDDDISEASSVTFPADTTPSKNTSFLNKTSKTHFKSPASFGSNKKKKSFTSPATSIDESFMALATRNGTKDTPYIVYANTEYPEKNRDFDIVFISQMEHESHEYQGFEICRAIAVPDFDLWEMTIPTAKTLPVELKGF